MVVRRFPVGEVTFDLKTTVKPSQGFPLLKNDNAPQPLADAN
jgi:hypothetical protein